MTRENFIIELDGPGEYEVVLDSDAAEFGGRNLLGVQKLKSEIRAEDGREVLKFTLPALSGVILRKTDRTEPTPKKRGRPRKTESAVKNTAVKNRSTKKAGTKSVSGEKKRSKKTEKQ